MIKKLLLFIDRRLHGKDDLAIALWNRGLILYNMEHWDESRADVNQAIALWNDELRGAGSGVIRRLEDAHRLLRAIDGKKA